MCHSRSDSATRPRPLGASILRGERSIVSGSLAEGLCSACALHGQTGWRRHSVGRKHQQFRCRLLHPYAYIGEIDILTAVEGRTLRLRRVARPNAEQVELLAALKLNLPERLCVDREVPDPSRFGLPVERTPPKM